MQPVMRSSRQLVFLSPSVISDRDAPSPISSGFDPVAYNVSFTMDAVTSVRRTFGVFVLLPNPRLKPFKDDRKKYRGEILTIDVSTRAFCFSFQTIAAPEDMVIIPGSTGVHQCIQVPTASFLQLSEYKTVYLLMSSCVRPLRPSSLD